LTTVLLAFFLLEFNGILLYLGLQTDQSPLIPWHKKIVMCLKEKFIGEALRQFSTKGFLNTSSVEIVQATGTFKPGADIDKIVEMIYPGPLGACVMYTSDKSRQNLTIGALFICIDSICKNSKTEQINTNR